MNDVKKILKQATREGWITEHGKHIKLRHLSGALVVVSRSVSDFRAARNIRSDLLRALKKKSVTTPKH